jgi:hypothetical protein
MADFRCCCWSRATISSVENSKPISAGSNGRRTLQPFVMLHGDLPAPLLIGLTILGGLFAGGGEALQLRSRRQVRKIWASIMALRTVCPLRPQIARPARGGRWRRFRLRERECAPAARAYRRGNGGGASTGKSCWKFVRRALETLAFPSGEVGPVESWALARFAANWFSDAIGSSIRGRVKCFGLGRRINIGLLPCDRIRELP